MPAQIIIVLLFAVVFVLVLFAFKENKVITHDVERIMRDYKPVDYFQLGYDFQAIYGHSDLSVKEAMMKYPTSKMAEHLDKLTKSANSKNMEKFRSGRIRQVEDDFNATVAEMEREQILKRSDSDILAMKKAYDEIIISSRPLESWEHAFRELNKG